MKITKDIDVLISDLKDGKVVCFKTDTIWGLSALVCDNKAINEIYKIKNRTISKPILSLISKKMDYKNIITISNDLEKEIIKNHWPNPLTIVFKTNKNTKIDYYKKFDTVALRMPKDKNVEYILNNVNCPILSTSVNKEHEKELNSFEEVKNFLKNYNITILNDDNEKNENKNNKLNNEKISSTLIKCFDGKIEILRQGSFIFNNQP